MNLPSFGQWLIALIVCAVVVVLCVRFADLPVALFMHAHFRPDRLVAHALDIVILFVPFGVLSIFLCGCVVLAKRALPRWALCLAAAGFSMCWAIATNYFLLQPAFGRIDFDAWLSHGLYGFAWLHGHGGTGFPSGHATLTASFLVVFWLFYPRARMLLALLIAAEAAGLVLMNWHFVSDVLGGLFLGSSAAMMTCALSECARPPEHEAG
ncbi:MAG: phosphatase PAP2 family protein [Rhizomicrobium sp.]|jgi:membrane-associated phospholipid phosphatase